MPIKFLEEEQNRINWARLVGFVLGDGGVVEPTNQQRYLEVSQVKPEDLTYIRNLINRLNVALPLLRLRLETQEAAREQRWTSWKADVVDFFWPLVFRPRSYDPLDDQHVREYDASHYHKIADTPDNIVNAVPRADGFCPGDWGYLRCWLG
ncbi:uncharacterized protein PSFLO_02080 [Pseudozyma flocculosa]|uniref:Uncharacterized protein n=1 Tax=Pseudozyma flocculosa TaxID=84751 RepID=A0A5C3EZL8_9BASI|nr:uncharacterized protein PSFLO_02080 [Pseudozyma flocculosa]